jgi:hypothetical protein
MQMRWPNPIDHTYILCNVEKEPARAEYLTKWLTAHQIDPACYTLGVSCYKDTLSPEDYAKYNPWQSRGQYEKHRNFNSYNLKPGEISLVLNWAGAARAAVDAGHKVVMILESDVLFDEGFLEKLGAALESFHGQDVWDFLSLSAGADLRPSRPDGDMRAGWFPAPGYYHTRTTDAMIFRVSMLSAILGTLFPFAEVLDWELNFQLSINKSRSFWLDPPIIKQGSGKVYPTTL